MRALHVIACAVSLQLVGCHATWDVPHPELVKLDGYCAPRKVSLNTTSGEKVLFGPSTYVRLASDEKVYLTASTVRDGVFTGVVRAREPYEIRFPLRKGGSITVVERDWTMTGFLMLGLTAIPIGLLVLVCSDNNACAP